LPADFLGLEIAHGAYVYFPPNIAGFVGSDHVAMLLVADLWKTDKTVLALDIGTNTEISLVHEGRLISCSTASGPAFEGAHIQHGMRAGPGAIERVQVVGDEIRTFTVGRQSPTGICGSGILDAIAGLLASGVIDRKGHFGDTTGRVRTCQRTQRREFILVPGSATGHGRDIVVTRSDINEIQLAKAAIRAGQEILLETAGIDSEAVDEIVVAGAFGTYLDVESAISVGLFLDLPRSRFRQMGNIAGAGARQMLVSSKRRQLAMDIVRRLEYIELTTHPGFEEAFTKALYF
jgi:uncharacterized 2Fe-2S/4Fe-4S cluster protein (DUF4445 family)